MKLFDHVSRAHCGHELSVWLCRFRDDGWLRQLRASHPSTSLGRTHTGSRQSSGFVAPRWESCIYKYYDDDIYHDDEV
eukprot:10984608-Karenia_brevis.AAC.1